MVQIFCRSSGYAAQSKREKRQINCTFDGDVLIYQQRPCHSHTYSRNHSIDIHCVYLTGDTLVRQFSCKTVVDIEEDIVQTVILKIFTDNSLTWIVIHRILIEHGMAKAWDLFHTGTDILFEVLTVLLYMRCSQVRC